MSMQNQLILGVLGMVLPYVISGAVALFHLLLEKLPSNQAAMVETVVGKAVNAVEQMAKQGLSSPEKKQLAQDQIIKVLAAMHIKADPALISILIEDAVYQLNQMEVPVESHMGFESPAPEPGN